MTGVKIRPSGNAGTFAETFTAVTTVYVALINSPEVQASGAVTLNLALRQDNGKKGSGGQLSTVLEKPPQSASSADWGEMPICVLLMLE